jgi:hypothetical protein
MAQVAEPLPSKLKALNSIPTTNNNNKKKSEEEEVEKRSQHIHREAQ